MNNTQIKRGNKKIGNKRQPIKTELSPSFNLKELKQERKQLKESIYKIGCYSVKDLLRLNEVEKQIDSFKRCKGEKVNNGI